MSAPDFTCDGCGICCLHVTAPPFERYDGDDPEFHALPAALQKELLAAYERIYGPAEPRVPFITGAPCLWFDAATRKCLHYVHRPQECRDYAVGSPECLDDRKRLVVLNAYRKPAG